MSASNESQAVVADDSSSCSARAVALLEKAVQGESKGDAAFYLLALAYKRQGRNAEAHATLCKINRPDAIVLLQMALLSLRENQVAQAESELERAWQMDQSSYEVCYNLLLTRLTLGRIAAATEMLPGVIDLAGQRGDMERKYFLSVLYGLFRVAETKGEIRFEPPLIGITADHEKHLLAIIQSLGHLDTIFHLLEALSVVRSSSAAIRDAHFEVALVKAKDLMDRCSWTEALLLLRSLVKQTSVARPHRVALLNLLGCCTCLTHDFDNAVRYFTDAAKLAGNDARLHQNLALVYEFQDDWANAESSWNRYFDLLDTGIPSPLDVPCYSETLAFYSLRRLADHYREKEKWTQALDFTRRAQRLRPSDTDMLEQTFHLLIQVKKTQEARKTLNQLRKLKPDDPRLNLFELDLIEVKKLNDVDQLLSEIDRILKRYPDDTRVEERAIGMVGNVIPLISSLCNQLTDQMGKVLDRVRNLPKYQINWSAVRDAIQDIQKEFYKLRRITNKCLQLIKSDGHRRLIRELIDHIDKKIETCKSMMG